MLIFQPTIFVLGEGKKTKVAAPPIPFHQNHPETHLWSSLTFVFGHQIGTWDFHEDVIILDVCNKMVGSYICKFEEITF